MSARANGDDRLQIAPRGNSVLGKYVCFELAILNALVDLGVEDGRWGGVAEVAFAQRVGRGTVAVGGSKGVARGAGAGGGWGDITSLGRRGHHVDELGVVWAMA